MRVAYINKVVLDSTLPAVNFSFSLVLGLAEAGARVSFFAQCRDVNYRVEQLYNTYGRKPEPNLDIDIYHKTKILGFSSATFFYLNTLVKILKSHRKDEFSAIISRDPNCLPWLMIFKLWGIKTAYQPHNFYMNLKLHTDVNRKNARRYSFLKRVFLPHVDRVICLQEAQQELYKAFLPESKVKFAHPGHTEAHAITKKISDKVIFAYIGSMQWKKGIDTIIAAFEKSGIDNAELWLIGGRDETEPRSLHDAVSLCPVKDRIKLFGWLPWKNVADLLREIHIGIIPLHDTFYNRFLTAPNKLFDYWAFGTPVIASDLPSIRCFVHEDQDTLLYSPENITELTALLCRISSDTELYSSMNLAVIQTAKTYLWKNRAVDFLACLE